MGGKHSKAGCTKSEWSSEAHLRSSEPAFLHRSRPPKPTSDILQSRIKTKPPLIPKLGLGIGSVGSFVTMSAESDSMSQGVPLIDIMDFLECQVCICFVASPIYSCPNGHVICGICKPKISKCPSCDAKNLAVNGLVERVLKNKGVETACRNDYVGCTRRIKVWEMKDHLDHICDFRLIKCNEINSKNCENEACEDYYVPKDLMQHWISFHGAKITEVEVFGSTEEALPTESSVSLNLLGAVAKSYCLNKDDYGVFTVNGDDVRTGRCPVTYFKLDNQTFFIHDVTYGDTFHLWITLLGDESEAKNYQFTCTVSSNLCTSQPKREVTFRGTLVHSLQYYDFKKVRELGCTAAIRLQSLKTLQDEEPMDPERMLEWKMRIALSKV